MQQMLKQAQKMQQQIAKAQAELAEAELTGTAGGGLVTATVSGSGDIKSIKIDPKAVDPEDVETLEDLVVAALHNAAEAARVLTEQKMGPVAGGAGGLGLPGF
ncbi:MULTISPECIES: YbaB/EbfC family nucleoid-associated protein [Micromonospora]|uniref:Nucleoid-associated protein ACH4OY_21840 n=1 Tax=Micromonospora rubida TaxID=2697657 RepID=A0ABW7SQX3_9ACTN|nr:YbaB/EbfC family nucleoid-associated protein [Micromonospora rubida]